MKRSILITFVTSFFVTFVAGLAMLSALATGQGGMMMGAMGGLPDLSQLVLLFEVSLLIAALFSGLNYLENRRIAAGYDADIARLARNESPENAELSEIQQRVSELSAELQRLSADSSAERAAVVEEERRRISRELHDSVSQELFAATMILSSVTEAGGVLSADQMATQTRLALKILHEAQNEMRALLLHLRPTELAGKSLSDGLRSLIDELTAKISCDINYKLSDIAAPVTVEDNLFRMAQEILSNTLRHAKATTIDVSLREHDNVISLRIADDGVGFDATDVKSASYGLKNLRERALLLGGTCQISSRPEAGTTVEISIPKFANERDEKNG